MPRCSACAAPREYRRSVNCRSRSMVSVPTIRPASSSLILTSCPVAALVAGVKMGSGSRSDSRSAGRQLDAAHRSALLIFLPSRPRQVPARDAFDRKRLGLADQHRPPAERIRIAMSGSRVVLRPRRAQVVRHDVARFAEPERRQLRQHLAFVRNAGAEDVVEGGNAVGRDNQQNAGVVGKRIDISDFPLIMTSEAVERGLEDGRRKRQWIANVTGEIRRWQVTSGTTTNAFLAFPLTPLIVDTPIWNEENRYQNPRYRRLVAWVAGGFSEGRPS